MTTIQEFDFSVNLLRAILWQYNDAQRLQALLTGKDAWYLENQSEFWTSWTRDVFNLKTANSFGLSVWSLILDVPLSYGIEGSGARQVFGFGPYNLNFENSNFGRDSAGVISLTLEQQRAVLRLRFYQLVNDGSVPFVNRALLDVFGEGYVLDGLNMTATYIFPRTLSSGLQAILEKFDLLPRPAGVEITALVEPDEVFGFAPYYLNFENGVFGANR